MEPANKTHTIPFFNYQHFFTSQESELTQVFTDVGRRGAFILQKDLVEFEANLAKYTGSKYAFGVANGTDALIIALHAAGIGNGDEVIFSSHTFIATAAAIHFAGAVPVAADCGPDHEIDPESVKQRITSNTKAIMPTQLNGRCCNMDELQEIATAHGLVIIEDAAQGLGAKFNGKMAGTFGLAGTISFYPAKTLGCLGDGGAILTNSDEMAEKIAGLRDHGRNPAGDIVAWGLNSRLDNLQAAFLNLQLARFDHVVRRRREMATLYSELLSGVSEVTAPPAPGSNPRYFDAYQNFEIRAERRDSLREYLKANAVGTLIQWGGKAVHQLKDLNVHATLPYTDYVFEHCLLLPFNMSLTDDDIRTVSHHIGAFYTNA